MKKKNLEARFSCKRKRDYVTYAAVVLFGLMLCFQIYLIVILPIQLKKAETLEHHVLRERVLLEMDKIRKCFEYISRHDVPQTEAEAAQPEREDQLNLQKGELEVTRQLFERQLAFVREHSDDLSISQLNEVMRQLYQIRSAIIAWQPIMVDDSLKPVLDAEGRHIPKKKQYSFREEKLNQKKYVKMLNARLNKPEN